MSDGNNLTPETIEYFEFKDPVNRQTVELPKTIDGVDLQELIGHAISKTRKETKEQIEKRYQPLMSEAEKYRTQSEELEAELQKLTDQNMSVDDIRKRDAEKWSKKLQDIEKKADHNWNLFRQNQIENDLYKAMAGHDLCNAQQTMMLLKSLGNPDLVEDDGKYRTVMKMALPDESGTIVEQELDPGDAFKKWINLEENRHLLKNNLRSGGGSNNLRTGGDSQPITSFSREELGKNPEARKAFLQRIKSGESINIET